MVAHEHNFNFKEASLNAKSNVSWAKKSLRRDKLSTHAIEQVIKLKSLNKLLMPYDILSVESKRSIDLAKNDSFKAFKQRDFGYKGENNCAIVALMTCLINMRNSNKGTLTWEESRAAKSLYRTISKVAKSIKYNPSVGMLPFMIKAVTAKTIRHLGISQKICTKDCFLGLSKADVNWVCNRLEHSFKPGIISVSKSNQGRYKMHSMVLVGIEIIEVTYCDVYDKDKTYSESFTYITVKDATTTDTVYIPTSSIGFYTHLLMFA